MKSVSKFLFFIIFFITFALSSYGVHLSFTGNLNELSVMFSQPPNHTDSYYVKYGISPNELNYVVNATKATLEIISPLEYSRDTYQAVLTDLTSDSAYYYRIYSSTDPSKYEESTFFFNTFAEDNRGETTTPTEFISVADGWKEKFEEINLHLNQSGVILTSKFMIFPGDFSFSYPYGDDSWEDAEEDIMPFSGYSPVIYAPGNHDEDDSGSSWYGWEHRVSKLAGDNSLSEHNFSVGSEQYNWFEEELTERVNRDETPLLFVQFHKNMYTSSTGHSSYIEFRDELEHFLIDHKVTLVFTGHVHGYERTCEVSSEVCIMNSGNVNNTNLTDGVVHVIVGTGGRPLKGWVEPKPDWSVIRFSEFGYLKCVGEIVPDPLVSCQFVQVIDLDTTEILDEFSVGYVACDGKYPYEVGYCNGRGYCVAGDGGSCRCEENYFGDGCDITTCYGVFSNTSLACNSSGECIDFNVCNCTYSNSTTSCVDLGDDDDDDDDEEEDDDGDSGSNDGGNDAWKSGVILGSVGVSILVIFCCAVFLIFLGLLCVCFLVCTLAFSLVLLGEQARLKVKT